MLASYQYRYYHLFLLKNISHTQNTVISLLLARLIGQCRLSSSSVGVVCRRM